MRVAFHTALALTSTILAAAAGARAQAPGDDSTRSRAVHQAGTLSTTADDAAFRRAEQLVREGRGEAGRALVDSILVGTRAGSALHGQAMYWRASLAADAAEAERGYRRVILEYPASRWAGDALVNLAQLEMARGDHEQALMHLHRFEREYSSHESRGRASLWLARLYFDKKNERRGCALLATARLAASPDDVELRNQIDHHEQRCIGVDTVVAAPVHPIAGATTGVNVPTAARPPVAPASTARTAPHDTVPDSSLARAAVPVTPPSLGVMDSASRPWITVGGYTVQVAAYSTRRAAEALIVKLQARGYTARLATTTRPFRVRIGRYDTRAEAVAAQQRLKTKGIMGFVTEMESRNGPTARSP